VIGSAASSGIVTLENSSTQTVDIASITIIDDAAGEFAPDAANPWPATFPTSVLAGTKLKLGISLTPTGAPGMRRARLRVITSMNDTFYVNITGEAGTRSIAANPTSLFDGTSVTVGTSIRQSFSITNTGTLPVVLQTPVLSGSADYAIGKLPRLVLEPGAVEYVEVTFTPSAATSLPATITINSDATGGAVTVALNGSGARTNKGTGDDPTTALPGVDQSDVRFGEIGGSTTSSGVAAAVTKAGVGLSTAQPNPAREVVELRYSLERSGQVELGLYDERGVELQVLASGSKGAGTHTVRVNVGTLPSGVYHYRLVVDGTAISNSFTVVK